MTKSVAVGSGLASMVVGTNASVTVVALDSFANHRTQPTPDAVKVELTNPSDNQLPVQASATVNGSTNIWYIATVSAQYKLSVMIDNQHINNSPYEINVTSARAHGANCFVRRGRELEQIVAVAGTDFIFEVQVRHLEQPAKCQISSMFGPRLCRLAMSSRTNSIGL